MKSRITLAQRYGQTIILRAYSKEEPLQTPEAASVDSLNRLILSKNLRSLIDSIDELGAMLPANLTKHDQRILAVEEVRKLLADKKFKKVDYQQLSNEMLFASRFPYRPNKKALSEILREHDLPKSNFETTLTRFADDDIVILERIQDWMELRNSLAVTARVMGNLHNPPKLLKGEVQNENSNGLLRAGFQQKEVSKLMKNTWGLQHHFFRTFSNYYHTDFVYNPYKLDRYAGEILEKRTPYHHSVISCKPNWYTALRNQNQKKRVLFLTDQLIRDDKKIEDMDHQLCIGYDGEDWRSLAQEFITSMIKGYMNPKIDWATSQWSQHPTFENSTLIEALWNQLLYSKGHSIIVCQTCGDATLSPNRGKPSVYCSGTCRNYYNEHYISR